MTFFKTIEFNKNKLTFFKTIEYLIKNKLKYVTKLTPNNISMVNQQKCFF